MPQLARELRRRMLNIYDTWVNTEGPLLDLSSRAMLFGNMNLGNNDLTNQVVAGMIPSGSTAYITGLRGVIRAFTPKLLDLVEANVVLTLRVGDRPEITGHLIDFPTHFTQPIVIPQRQNFSVELQWSHEPSRRVFCNDSHYKCIRVALIGEVHQEVY